MTPQQNSRLATMTKKLLDNGLDYIVTLNSQVTVELIEMNTQTSMGVTIAETVEDALEELMERIYQ